MNCRVSFAAITFLFLSGAAFAQDGGATGTPRELSPVPGPDNSSPGGTMSREGIEVAPLPPAPGTTESTAPLSAPLGAAPAPVYSPADNSSLGLLDDSNGGLGGVLWHGTTRQMAVALLPQLPVATKSPAMNAIARRLLLTQADAPSGHAAESFMALRLERLYDAGLIDDVAALGARLQDPDEREQAVHVDALLLLGRKEDACGGASAARLESSEDYWLHIRAFCYAVEGNAPGISLTIELMRSQHIEADTFYALAAQIEEGAKPVKIKSYANPEPVTLALFALAKAPLPPGILKDADPATLHAVALGEDYDAKLRLEAGYRAAMVGALAPEDLASLLQAQSFKPAQLKDPVPSSSKLAPEVTAALFYQAAKAATDNTVKVKIISDALAYADARDAFPLYAQLFAPLAEEAFPSPDLAAYAPQIARAMLFARRFSRVQDWYAVVESASAQATLAVNALQIRFAIAQPSQFEAGRAQSAIMWLVAQSANLPPGDPLRRRAMFEAGLLDALGFVVPPEARLQLLGPVAGPPAMGTLPTELDVAAGGYRIGETVIQSLKLIGSDGPGAARDETIISVAGALNAVGLDADARAIALEALLAEPVGGS